MIRAIIDTFTGVLHKIARFSATGRADEYINNREAMQHYGFASRPKNGAEGIVIQEGNHLVMIADDDRRYRIALEDGEVAIYTDQGDKVHLKRDHNIDIIAAGTPALPGNINIKADGTMVGKVTIEAGGEVDIIAPVVKLGGMALETALGVVTGACSCQITGAPHAVVSQTVKATL